MRNIHQLYMIDVYCFSKKLCDAVSLPVSRFPIKNVKVNLLEIFDFDSVSKHVGSGKIIGRSGSRQFTTQMDDATEITCFLTRYLSAKYSTIGKNICWTPNKFVIPICIGLNPSCFINT